MKKEMVVDLQRKAYNANDIDAFIQYFDDNVIAISLDDQKYLFSSKKDMIPLFEKTFSKFNPHCKLKNRIVMGDVVIDHELITYGDDGDSLESVTMYCVGENHRIINIYNTNGKPNAHRK